MDCIQITERKKNKQKTGVKNKKGCQIEKKKSYPHQKRVSNRKKKKPSTQEKRKQTILKYLDFLPSLFKRPVCRRSHALEHCRRRRRQRALVVGRRSLSCVVCWSAAVALENVVCVAGARAAVHRTGDCC